MSTITIPSSLDSAKTELTAIGSLINAKKWQRAAIVATYVTIENPGGRGNRSKLTGFLSPLEFAELDIVGLSSKNTVQRYVETWLAVRPRPQPGEVVDLTSLPEWPAAASRPQESKPTTTADRPPSQRELRQPRAEEQGANVNNSEVEEMRDENEARLKLTEPVWQARYNLGFVIGDWSRFRPRLSGTDLRGLRDGIRGIEEHLDVIKMLLSDDIVGEVLRHESGQATGE